MVTSIKSPAPLCARLDTSLELLFERAPAANLARVLATVVATAGSTYRKPGARMLIMADGSYLGLLSGGCLESDLQIHARQVLDGAGTKAVEYDMRGPDDVLFGIGSGCEGAMRVLLEPANSADRSAAALASAARITAAGESTCLVCVHESGDVALGTYSPGPGDAFPPALSAAVQAALAERSSREVVIGRGAERLRAFVQFLAPPPHLLLCGAGPDAQPVVAAARTLGWRVTVVDHRPAYAETQRFPGARVVLADPGALRDTVELAGCHAAVVMSHHLPSDIVYLRALAASETPGYIGLLGPSARRGRILNELGPSGDSLSSRLRGPVGLDIGAETPGAIALAIIAEAHAWLAGRLVASSQHERSEQDRRKA